MVAHPATIFVIDCDPDICLQRIRAGLRPITYFESGARHVPHLEAPMIERGEWERKTNSDREAGLRMTLTRMREKFLELAASYPRVHVIDNSAGLDDAV